MRYKCIYLIVIILFVTFVSMFVYGIIHKNKTLIIISATVVIITYFIIMFYSTCYKKHDIPKNTNQRKKRRKKIKSVLDSLQFKNEVIKATSVSKAEINRKILKYFKKDFWKEFI